MKSNVNSIPANPVQDQIAPQAQAAPAAAIAAAAAPTPDASKQPDEKTAPAPAAGAYAHAPQVKQPSAVADDEKTLPLWYSDKTITKLLAILLGDRVHIAPVFTLEHDAFLEILQTAIRETTSQKPTVLPIQVDEGHWSGMVIKKFSNPDRLQVIYNDSKGTSLQNHLQIAAVIQQITAEYPHAQILDLRLKQQHNDIDCGPFDVDNLYRLASADTQHIQDSDAMCTLLVVPADGSATVLRQQHEKLLGIVTERKDAKAAKQNTTVAPASLSMTGPIPRSTLEIESGEGTAVVKVAAPTGAAASASTLVAGSGPGPSGGVGSDAKALVLEDSTILPLYYSELTISTLLNAMLRKEVVIILRKMSGNELLSETLRKMVLGVIKSKKLSVFITEIKPNHWATFVFNPLDRGEIQLIYCDPKGKALSSVVQSKISESFVDPTKFKILDASLEQTFIDESTGPFAIDNAFRLIHYRNDLRHADMHVIRQMLMIPRTQADAAQLREIHGRVLKNEWSASDAPTYQKLIVSWDIKEEPKPTTLRVVTQPLEMYSAPLAVTTKSDSSLVKTGDVKEPPSPSVLVGQAQVEADAIEREGDRHSRIKFSDSSWKKALVSADALSPQERRAYDLFTYAIATIKNGRFEWLKVAMGPRLEHMEWNFHYQQQYRKDQLELTHLKYRKKLYQKMQGILDERYAYYEEIFRNQQLLINCKNTPTYLAGIDISAQAKGAPAQIVNKAQLEAALALKEKARANHLHEMKSKMDDKASPSSKVSSFRKLRVLDEDIRDIQRELQGKSESSPLEYQLMLQAVEKAHATAFVTEDKAHHFSPFVAPDYALTMQQSNYQFDWKYQEEPADNDVRPHTLYVYAKRYEIIPNDHKDAAPVSAVLIEIKVRTIQDDVKVHVITNELRGYEGIKAVLREHTILSPAQKEALTEYVKTQLNFYMVNGFQQQLRDHLLNHYRAQLPVRVEWVLSPGMAMSLKCHMEQALTRVSDELVEEYTQELDQEAAKISDEAERDLVRGQIKLRLQSLLQHFKDFLKQEGTRLFCTKEDNHLEDFTRESRPDLLKLKKCLMWDKKSQQAAQEHEAFLQKMAAAERDFEQQQNQAQNTYWTEAQRLVAATTNAPVSAAGAGAAASEKPHDTKQASAGTTGSAANPSNTKEDIILAAGKAAIHNFKLQSQRKNPIYLMSQLPPELMDEKADEKEFSRSSYRNSYIFVKSKPVRLLHVDRNGRVELHVDEKLYEQLVANYSQSFYGKAASAAMQELRPDFPGLDESQPLQEQLTEPLLKQFWDIIHLNREHSLHYWRCTHLAYMRDADGNTLLHYAMAEYARSLVESDSLNETLAATAQLRVKTLYSMIELLYEFGAMPYWKNENGQNAHQYADEIGKERFQGMQKQKQIDPKLLKQPDHQRLPNWAMIRLGLHYLETYSPAATRFKEKMEGYSKNTQEQLDSFWRRIWIEMSIKELRRNHLSNFLDHLETGQKCLTDEPIRELVDTMLAAKENSAEGIKTGRLNRSELRDLLQEFKKEINDGQLVPLTTSMVVVTKSLQLALTKGEQRANEAIVAKEAMEVQLANERNAKAELQQKLEKERAEAEQQRLKALETVKQQLEKEKAEIEQQRLKDQQAAEQQAKKIADLESQRLKDKADAEQRAAKEKAEADTKMLSLATLNETLLQRLALLEAHILQTGGSATNPTLLATLANLAPSAPASDAKAAATPMSAAIASGGPGFFTGTAPAAAGGVAAAPAAAVVGGTATASTTSSENGTIAAMSSTNSG